MEKGQIRQIGFARKLKERLDNEHPELAAKLDETELLLLIELFFKEISILLRLGYRVIFEGFVSFYTKPIKRKCTNLQTGEDWMTFKRRLRWIPQPNMKKLTEVEITESEYNQAMKKDKEKTPAGV